MLTSYGSSHDLELPSHVLLEVPVHHAMRRDTSDKGLRTSTKGGYSRLLLASRLSNHIAKNTLATALKRLCYVAKAQHF